MRNCPSCSCACADNSRFCPWCAAPLDTTSAETEVLASPGSPGLSSSSSVDEGRFVPGTILAGRYRIAGLLGRGGMGEVYRATDLTLGQAVALKFLPEATARDERMLARFYNEVRIARQVAHPNVCRVYDIGQVEGLHYISMEYVDGEDLGSLLRRIGRLPVDKALETARKLCAGLAAAHEKGVLHRDLKPANVMLGDFGEVYVLDWGLAKVVGTPEPRLPSGPPAIASGSDPGAKTVHGATMGTPGYMAPEQVRGETVDARADVYALGAILFELLALEPLHPHGSAEAAKESTLAGIDARPSRRAPERDLPPELDEICARATERDADARTRSVREVVDAVERYLDGDRDLLRRRALAREHVMSAGKYTDRALAGGKEATQARSLALREIGRAVALDPTDSQAVTTLMRLMTETPAEMPPEARAAMQAETRGGIRAAARTASVAYLLWFAHLPLMLWMGIRSWPAYLVASAAWLVAAATAYASSRKPPRDGSRPFGMTLAGVVAVATSATLCGPYVIIPTIAAIGSMLMHMSPYPRGRIMVMALNCLAIAAPAALQALGVLPASYVFAHDSIVIMPLMLGFPPVPTQVFLLVNSLALIVAASVMLARVRNVLTGIEERMYVHTWQLRQLVPEQARPASARLIEESVAQLPDPGPLSE
jgi:predicted Ser/Thr protein kinase